MGVKDETELLDRAWGIIANGGGGDWDKEHPDWKQAAINWRDDYDKWLDKYGGKPEGVKMEKTTEQMAAEDEAFERHFRKITARHGNQGYKKGSFISWAILMYRIHRKAKKYGMGSLLTIKLGKDL